MARAEPATGPRASPNREYGPPKTLYNRWKRWGDMDVFAPPFMPQHALVPSRMLFPITMPSAGPVNAA
jgi:hypothetical protein